jgi:hypothetical protein
MNVVGSGDVTDDTWRAIARASRDTKQRRLLQRAANNQIQVFHMHKEAATHALDETSAAVVMFLDHVRWCATYG